MNGPHATLSPFLAQVSPLQSVFQQMGAYVENPSATITHGVVSASSRGTAEASAPAVGDCFLTDSHSPPSLKDTLSLPSKGARMFLDDPDDLIREGLAEIGVVSRACFGATFNHATMSGRDSLGLTNKFIEYIARNQEGGVSKMDKSIMKPSDIRNLLIIVAMDVEREALLTDTNYDTEIISDKLGISIDRFAVDGHNVMIAKSGVGLVNASLTLALIYEKYAIDAVLVTGVGGALDPKLNIGDVVISEHVLQHDSVYTGDNGDELMASGELYLSLPEDQRIDPLISAEPVLVDWIVSMFSGIRDYGHAVYKGTVLSGSEFVASYRRKKKLAGLNENSLLVDMESSGVAQMSRRLGLPFAVVKVVADRINPDESISTDYRRFLSAASKNAAALLKQLVNTFNENE